MLIRLFVILCALITSTTLHAAEKRQTGNIIYTPPKDWKIVGSVRKEGWVTIRNKRKDKRCQYCYIRVHVGAPAKGSFKVWLRERMKVALGDGKVKKNLRTKVIRDKKYGKLHIYPRRIKGRIDETQLFFAFETEDRWEMIHFEGETSDADDLKEFQAAVSEEFVPILDTIGFISEGAEPVLGDPIPGSLDGTWFGRKITHGMNLDLSLRLDVSDVIYTFWPDGRFYEGIPQTGVRDFDPDDAILTETSKVGNYRIRGRKVVLDYADGDTDSLKLKGEAMQYGNAYLSKVRITKDGFRFKGTLSKFRYSPFGAGISGGVATSNKWEFFEDGTYETDSYFGAAGSFDTGGGFATSKDSDAKRGRYEVANGLIRLSRPEDNEIVWPFFIAGQEGEEKIAVRGEFLD